MPDDPGFDTFWGDYPRRVGKGHARKAWTKALKKADSFAILRSLYAQIDAGMFDRETKYIPHPTTWLNAERWSDDVAPRHRPAFRNPAIELLARDAEAEGRWPTIANPTMIAHGDD